MFLPQSDAIAEAHTSNTSEIERVDELIYTIGAFPVRADQMCDNVGMRRVLFERILSLYVSAGVLRKERRRYCSACESLIELDDDDICDSCEALFKQKAPDVFEVFVAADPIIRAEPGAETDGSMGEVVRIQFVAGDRRGTQRNLLQIPKEHRAIRTAIESAAHRDYFQVLDAIHAASLQDLGTLYTVNATIIHFGGHGDDRSLSFVLDQELLAQTVPVSADQLAAILGAFPKPIRLCVFNTCESAEISHGLVRAGVLEFAIGWRGKIADGIAIRFTEQFYRHVGNGLSVGQAFALAEACNRTGDSSAGAVLAAADGMNAREYSPLKT